MPTKPQEANGCRQIVQIVVTSTFFGGGGGGGQLKGDFSKSFFCIDLFPNHLYRN